jgi:hypothetical protein
LLELADHPPAADEVAKLHVQIIFLEGPAQRLGCKTAARASAGRTIAPPPSAERSSQCRNDELSAGWPT